MSILFCQLFVRSEFCSWLKHEYRKTYFFDGVCCYSFKYIIIIFAVEAGFEIFPQSVYKFSLKFEFWLSLPKSCFEEGECFYWRSDTVFQNFLKRAPISIVISRIYLQTVCLRKYCRTGTHMVIYYRMKADALSVRIYEW